MKDRKIIFRSFYLSVVPGITYFRSYIMKYLLVFLTVIFLSCTKHAPPHAPVGGMFSQEDLQASRNRIKRLNEVEKGQIEDWIAAQNQKFYPTHVGYWTDDADLYKNARRNDGERISYSYQLYDFDRIQLSGEPIQNKDVTLGRFEELKPVEDALRYMQRGQTMTMLVPSTLAFGTSGDGDRIDTDLPLIIILKLL